MDTRLPRAKQFTGITSVNGNHNHAYPTAGIWHPHRTWQGRPLTKDNPARYSYVQDGYTANVGNHQHNVAINGGGDPETRPKNIAVYTYIKIN